MARYLSAKTFTNFSVALRQWKAQPDYVFRGTYLSNELFGEGFSVEKRLSPPLKKNKFM